MHTSPKSGVCRKEDEAHVTVEMVVATFMKNAETAKAIIARAIPQIPAEPNWPCHAALKNAIMTERQVWPKKTIAELKPIIAKYF
jgi:5'-methylthioadenosine phosphorylase